MRLPLLTLTVLLLNLAALAQDKSQSLNSDMYTSVGGLFSIKLPGDPQKREAKSDQQIDTILTWGLKEGFVRIVASRRLDDVNIKTAVDRTDFVRGARKLVAAEPEFELGEKGEPVQFGLFRGEKFPLSVKGLSGYLTIIVAEKRSYMLLFISRPEIPGDLAKLSEAIATFTPAQ
jgi:hypothetical protein